MPRLATREFVQTSVDSDASSSHVPRLAHVYLYRKTKIIQFYSNTWNVQPSSCRYPRSTFHGYEAPDYWRADDVLTWSALLDLDGVHHYVPPLV